MDIELRSQVDVFNDTYTDMRKNFIFDGRKSNIMKALLSFTNDGGFDIDKVKEIRRYLLKNKIDIYNFKYRKILSMLVYDNSDYKKLLDISKDVYDNLTIKGFNKNKITLCLAVMLAKNFKGDKLDKIIDKIKLSKESIRFVDSKYDILLALNDKNVEDIHYEYELAKRGIESVDTYTDNMSSLLALSIMMGDIDVNHKIENAFALVCNIKGIINRISDESLIFIGIASLLIEDAEAFADELKNIYVLINSKRDRFKLFKKDYNLYISLIILICKNIEEVKSGIIESKINNEYLDFIQDYVICLMYFI